MDISMKTIDRIVLLCAFAAAMSACCQNNVVPPTPEPDDPDIVETRTLSFVLPAAEAGEDGATAAFKTAWKAGDQIVVHGEYAKHQVTVTLDASDISADGRTATKTVEGLHPDQREDCASTLYASYPASLVNNLKHCFFYSQFTTTNAQIMAASNSGDTFQFENICGVLAMKVEGDYEGYTLTTPKKEILGYEFLQVKITDREANYKQYLGPSIIQVDGTLDGSSLLVFLPDETSFANGFTLKFKEGGDYTRIYRYSQPVEVNRGCVVDLGDITADIQHYDNPFSSDILDLDGSGNANCYIVTAPGKYKFKAVYGNAATRFLEDVAGAEVLWETWNTADAPASGSVVASAAYAEDYIILHMPETLHPGNAVIAARNADGKILWSWHIWVPATPVTADLTDNSLGAPAMDRNLGALVATEAAASGLPDPLSFGLFYQWGRKDPFPGQASNSGNGPIAVTGEQMSRQPTPITTAEAIANPTLYSYALNGYEGYNWNQDEIFDAWGEGVEKAIYDPCPPGYRVPQGDGAAWSKSGGWVFNLGCGWFKIGTVVFPYCGYMDDNGGSYAKMIERSVVWNAKHESLTNGKCMYIKGAAYDGSTARAARGASVRCVVE